MLSNLVQALRAPLVGRAPEAPREEPRHIPLPSAYLCQDCNCVSNCSRRCPACASEVLMGLAGILNRETVETTPTQTYSYVTSMVA